MQKTTARTQLLSTGNLRAGPGVLTLKQVARKHSNTDAINARRAELKLAPVRRMARVG